MKLLSKILLAGGLLLAAMGGYAKTTDPALFVKTFYQEFLKGSGKMTPTLRNQLSPETAQGYSQWERCQKGEKAACATDCYRGYCQFGQVHIKEGFNYFTKTKKIDAKWATSLNAKVVKRNKARKEAVVALPLPGTPALRVVTRQINNAWKIDYIYELTEEDDS